ncbi:MAG: aldehyde dehydrogenase family protein [Deinococcales bacterium]
MSDASKHWNAASIRSGPASSTEPPTEPLRPLQRIAGRAVPAVRGGTREIVEPARGAVLAVVPEGTAEDAAAAVAAARQAFDAGPWPRLHAQERARVLHRAAALIEEHSEELARLETWDTGKTLPESRDDMAQVAEAFHYFGSLVATRGGEVNPVQAEALSLTLHEPIGVAALITPWNYPLPALVAGPDVDMVSFTGGIVTGRAIAKAAADTAKRVALELGGKNPNIVFEDADVDAALDHALNAVFYHAGQVCSAGSRLLVQEGLYERLVTGILERAAAIRLGFGWEDGTEMGPLVSEQHRAKVEGMIALALDEGATLRLGGGRPDGDRFRSGTFLQPTVLTEVRREMRIAHEEIFGPVLTVERFESEQDAIEAANGTRTGLAAAVWTRDVAKAVRVGRALRFGTVWLNDFHPYYPQAPWGGMKESGVGRELGLTGLREYQEEKHLYLNLDVRPVGWFGRSQGTTED